MLLSSFFFVLFTLNQLNMIKLQTPKNDAIFPAFTFCCDYECIATVQRPPSQWQWHALWKPVRWAMPVRRESHQGQRRLNRMSTFDFSVCFVADALRVFLLSYFTVCGPVRSWPSEMPDR